MRKIKIIIVLISAVFVNITVLNAQQWAPINNDIYFPFTGNVGISTTPNYKLDMYGTGSKAGIHLYKGGGVTASWYFNPGSLETGEFSIANDDITALTILPNGNIVPYVLN